MAIDARKQVEIRTMMNATFQSQLATVAVRAVAPRFSHLVTTTTDGSNSIISFIAQTCIRHSVFRCCAVAVGACADVDRAVWDSNDRGSICDTTQTQNHFHPGSGQANCALRRCSLLGSEASPRSRSRKLTQAAVIAESIRGIRGYDGHIGICD